MRYKIRDIDEQGLDIQEPVSSKWLAAECPDLDAKPAPGGISLRGRLEKSGDSYLLRGQLNGALVGTCARCLEPATIPLGLPMMISFVEEEPAEDEESEDVDDPAVLGFSGGVIDLGPAIGDELLLAMPIGPLCKEDCAGICPSCGGNRNLVPCDCQERQRQAQSKFSAISKLSVKN